MARRAGKAASRKARQRKVRRPVVASPPPASTPIPPVGTPDAREAESLNPPRRVSRPVATRAGSTLSAGERSEYHYVERDLRDIGILTAAMVFLLVVGWLAFTALGLVG